MSRNTTKETSKKIKLPSELAYLLAILILSFSVAMLTATDFGVSMIVAPAYLLSLKLGFLTFGQCEYLIQGVLFIVFCILVRKVKLVYFSSFLTGIIYGFALDMWRLLIPLFNPSITEPGNMNFGLKVVFFIIGVVFSSVSIAMFFRIYLYPQVYDFFVKGISQKFNLDRSKFKIAFDVSCLIISVAMTLLMFHGFVGIGIGTIIMTCVNGLLIGWCGKVIDRYIQFVPIAKKLPRYFDFNN